MWRSAESRASRSRICFCTVTSSAVVGSSAMSSSGLQESAIAMTTRCRMPPESSCGYCPSRRDGLGDADLREQLDGLLAGGLGGRVPDAGAAAR